MPDMGFHVGDIYADTQLLRGMEKREVDLILAAASAQVPLHAGREAK
jgi:hypothetical protein